jgi:uncharacterized protein (TIGR02145 family)
MKTLSTYTYLFLLIGITPFLTSCIFENSSNSFSCGERISDLDGYIYNTVRIGDFCIMADNLNSVTFKDGTNLVQLSDKNSWVGSNAPAWSYQSNSPNFAADFGKLYNWHAVSDTRGICPENWIVPSQDDWISIINLLGGMESAGGSLKSPGTYLWQASNSAATNRSGFSGNPGGRRTGLSGDFLDVYKAGFWWSSTIDEGANGAYGIVLNHDTTSVEVFAYR